MRHLAALALALFALAARAEPAVSSSRARVLYSVVDIGATAAANTGNLGMVGVNEFVVVLVNGNTTATRTPTFEFQDAASAIMFSITAAACAANTTCIYSFAKGATATGVTAGYAITPPPKFKVTTNAPASGAGLSKLYLFAR